MICSATKKPMNVNFCFILFKDDLPLSWSYSWLTYQSRHFPKYELATIKGWWTLFPWERCTIILTSLSRVYELPSLFALLAVLFPYHHCRLIYVIVTFFLLHFILYAQHWRVVRKFYYDYKFYIPFPTMVLICLENYRFCKILQLQAL